MKRKLFILCLLLVLVGTRASAYDFKVDGIYYNITSSTNLTASVTYKDYAPEYNQNAYVGDIIIPQNVTYDGKSYSVTSIGSAFGGCSGLTSITIPNSVTTI